MTLTPWLWYTSDMDTADCDRPDFTASVSEAAWLQRMFAARLRCDRCDRCGGRPTVASTADGHRVVFIVRCHHQRGMASVGIEALQGMDRDAAEAIEAVVLALKGVLRTPELKRGPGKWWRDAWREQAAWLAGLSPLLAALVLAVEADAQLGRFAYTEPGDLSVVVSGPACVVRSRRT